MTKINFAIGFLDQRTHKCLNSLQKTRSSICSCRSAQNSLVTPPSPYNTALVTCSGVIKLEHQCTTSLVTSWFADRDDAWCTCNPCSAVVTLVATLTLVLCNYFIYTHMVFCVAIFYLGNKKFTSCISNNKVLIILYNQQNLSATYFDLQQHFVQYFSNRSTIIYSSLTPQHFNSSNSQCTCWVIQNIARTLHHFWCIFYNICTRATFCLTTFRNL